MIGWEKREDGRENSTGQGRVQWYMIRLLFGVPTIVHGNSTACI